MFIKSIKYIVFLGYIWLAVFPLMKLNMVPLKLRSKFIISTIIINLLSPIRSSSTRTVSTAASFTA